MAISKLSSLLILPAVISAGFFAFASNANAATPQSCKASSGVKSIVYTVNGKVVPDLRGNVPQGATVVIDFKIATGCTNVPVNISAYEAPSGIWDPKIADKQVLVGSAKGTYSADGLTKSLSVVVASCYFQVDFSTGAPMTKVTGTNNQSTTGDLISADNGGTKLCTTGSTTTTTRPSTTTTAPCNTTTTVKQTTTTVPKTTTTTVPSSTTTIPLVTTTTVVRSTTTVPQSTTTTTEPETTTTTVLTEVLDKVVLPSEVQSKQLAVTGTESGEMLVIATLLVLIGGGLLALAYGFARKRIN